MLAKTSGRQECEAANDEKDESSRPIADAYHPADWSCEGLGDFPGIANVHLV